MGGHEVWLIGTFSVFFPRHNQLASEPRQFVGGLSSGRTRGLGEDLEGVRAFDKEIDGLHGAFARATLGGQKCNQKIAHGCI